MKSAPKNWALKISTAIVLTACFSLMCSGLILSQNFKDLVTLWGDEVIMSVYLAPDISLAGKDFVEKRLMSTKQVARVEYVSQEQALGEFRTQLASYAPDIAKDDELLRLIPGSLRVHLKEDVPAERQTEVFREIAAKVRILEGVEDVSYGQDWVEKYSAIVSAIQMTINLIGMIIFFAALFVISNTIRASIQSRRDEIVVMEMVGATALQIRKPFILEGATLGFASSTIAVILSYGMFSGVMGIITEKLSFFQLAYHLKFLNFYSVFLFIVGGAVLGAAASYLCIRRINDGFASVQMR